MGNGPPHHFSGIWRLQTSDICLFSRGFPSCSWPKYICHPLAVTGGRNGLNYCGFRPGAQSGRKSCRPVFRPFGSRLSLDAFPLPHWLRSQCKRLPNRRRFILPVYRQTFPRHSPPGSVSLDVQQRPDFCSIILIKLFNNFQKLQTTISYLLSPNNYFLHSDVYSVIKSDRASPIPKFVAN